MDKIENYKIQIAEEFKYQVSKRVSNTPDTQMRLYVGEDKNHFILFNIGWQEKRYIHTLFFNVEIIGDKVWVHEDNTDIDIAECLIKRGIPKEDIVLGFVPKYARDIEGFAVG